VQRRLAALVGNIVTARSAGLRRRTVLDALERSVLNRAFAGML